MNKAVQQTILTNVYDVVINSPLEIAKDFSEEINTSVHIKREDLQPVHSFKIRGAYNKISNLSQTEKDKGVITASAGNHAQGVALSSKKLNLSAQIVMPTTTPTIKVNAVKNLGGDVVLFGNNYSEAYEHCLELQKQSGRTFIHPFDDELVIAGQGTIGKEILEQLPETTHIFIPVGGGGLLAGVAQYVKSLKPEVKVIGVEPEDSNAMQQSIKANKLVELNHVGIFADGVAVKKVGKLTFEIAKKFVDEIITVNNDQICAGIKSIFQANRSIVEPAGALSIAGLSKYAETNDLKNAKCVVISSGANMTFEKLQFIAERTLLGSGKEVLFAIDLPEKPGALYQFCKNIVNGYSISEFSYRLNTRDKATIFVGISFSKNSDKNLFTEKLNKHKYVFKDLSNDELAKEHIRHMIGGRSENTNNEHLYEINFPERPGALADFLSSIGSKWNISLFHYRGQGADTGKVLIGFETEDSKTLEKALNDCNCEFDEAKSQAIDIFL